MQQNPVRSSVNGERDVQIRLLGTGAANPTVEIGQRVTVTRTAVGVFRVDFLDYPGTFINCSYMFGSLVASDTKGNTLTRGVPTTTNGLVSIFFSSWSSAFAADELLANEYIDLTIRFAETR